MSDINVTAHGINPETGEYLSPAERKARFKKDRLESKINPEVFRSGTVSSEKKFGGALVKSPNQIKIDVGSGIIKLDDFKFGKPEQKDTEVKPDTPETPEPDKESSSDEDVKFKSELENLLESLRKILNLKNKQNLLKDKLAGLTKKKTKSKGKTKSKSRQGKDVFGIGRKIKGSVTKAFGDIFGLFGDIISFTALNWLSDPNNKKTITKVVKFLSGVFKWINSAVSWAVDTTLTGFSELVSPNSSISTRIGGFFKLASVFFAFRWLKNPFKMVKDLRKVFKIVTKFGKFVNKTLAKPIKIVQKFIEKSLNKVLGRTFKGSLLKGVRRFILKVGGKSLFKVFKGLGRGFTKVISKIPFVGALLDFFLSVFVFKESPGRALFKSIGALLLGAIGSAIGPIGTILGGFSGDYLGGVLYDAWFGGQKNEKLEEKQLTREELVSQTEGGSGMSSFREDSDENAALQDRVRSSSTSGEFGEQSIIKMMDAKGINDKTERAMFLAQLNHESGNFKYPEEIWGPTADQRGYEGRSDLGNNQPGDGYKYRGRGYIQITGRWNYNHFGNKIGVDLINNPDLAAEPDIAAKIAWEYYNARVSRKAAQQGDINTVTKQINGGYNGLADRKSKFKKYMSDPTLTQITQQSTPTPTTQPTSTPTSTPSPTPPGADKNFLKTIQAPQPASFTPTRPVASPLPSLSSSRSIDKKLRSRAGGSVIPFIINNNQNNNTSTTVNSFPLNSTSITDLTPLNRI